MRTYIKFLISLYTISFFKVFITFFAIILITNVLEQLEFFKDINLTFYYLIFLSLLNTPSIIFEILPFIFLITTQFFFISLIEKNELEIFKYTGLNNLKITRIISIYAFSLSLIFIIVFYNFSALLKNSYLIIKNQYADDGKYLAVITDNGLWIKDEIHQNINIINANKIDNEFLLDVTISQFNKNFEFIRLIQSEKVNILKTTWKIFQPNILQDNKSNKLNEIELKSNFNLKKINSLFSNLSSLTVLDLFKLRNSYKSLNYSVVEIDSHLYRIISYPIYLTLITIFSSIIMFNIGYQKNSFFSITLGIGLSVIIYYINYFFNVLGTSEKIPVLLSVFLPLVILSFVNFTSIIKLNEK